MKRAVAAGLDPGDRKLRESRLTLGAELLAGAWLIVAAFVFTYAFTLAGDTGFWNTLVCGVVVAAVALIRLVQPDRARLLGVVNVLIAAWLIVSPFAFGYPKEGHRDALRTDSLIVGILLAIVAVISLTVAVRRRRGDFPRSEG
ncbi:SPW repeat domain-containing protein [Amycolatopsis jiangsuensis]|uniref:Putative membrane channel-forming protein YqfA (Hemolysin III family) n=1 Tax=Amycolatopsis jiangsuensis TaxID=1181879 RepID=A0A840J503_9PSEU|nr:SPW repeat protein [Amycolatopsis jiangsuensis]MBB4689110.1 putative membrane channel-forming protein YqfA (hemolysin III family) [Amycolatopsis jiangsuensis]